MSEDFEHQLLPPDNTNQELLKAMLLIDIEERLQSVGKEHLFPAIGHVTDEMRQRVATARHQHDLYHECREVREEISYDREEMLMKLNTALNGEGPEKRGKMTPSQQRVYEEVKDAVEGRNNQKLFFIDARGGTGKTFLLNQLLYYVRTLDNKAIALSVAFTGIAATLLQGGRTFNSRFKFPLKPNATSTCNITKQSGLARLIREAKLIVWDEGPMSDKKLLEGLDRKLRDLMDCNLPFGGKVVVMGGDFRQLPTIVPKGSRAQTVAASLKKSYLWQHFKILKLEENMRIRNSGNDPKLVDFDAWLKQLGEGTLNTIVGGESIITMPKELSVEIPDGDGDKWKQDAINFTFNDINIQSTMQTWPDFVSTRAILAPTNAAVNELNIKCLDQLSGDEVILASSDRTVNQDDAPHYPTEYINSLQTPGIPPHKLTLKKGAVAICLRNLNINSGLCNGTRLIIQDIINDRLLKATIANGEHKGKTVLIPKIVMKPADDEPFGFEWQRVQFPVRLAFAMTIHKSQGQTL